MHDPLLFNFWSIPLQAGLIDASRKGFCDHHAQQHACAQPIKNKILTPIYADVTLIRMPSVTLSLLQSCMCICSDSVLRAPNACTALKISHRVNVAMTVSYVPEANLAYQCSLDWQCLPSHIFQVQITWSSSCPCCSSGAVLLAAKLARMQVRSAAGLKTPDSGTCATTRCQHKLTGLSLQVKEQIVNSCPSVPGRLPSNTVLYLQYVGENQLYKVLATGCNNTTNVP